jgi:hypothetical protein
MTELQNTGVDTTARGILDSLAETGRHIKIVACVIRNNGSGWSFVEDAVHSKLNCLSVTADANVITVNYSFTSKKILSFVACVDDAFAQLGYFCGASVGNEYANIYVAQRQATNLQSGLIGGYIAYNGSTWVITSLNNSGNLAVADFTAGALNLTHDNVGMGYLADVSRRDTGYEPRLGSNGSGTSQIKFYDASGNLVTTPDTNCKVFFWRGYNTIPDNPIVKLNPQNIISASGNIWCIGVFEVD